MSKEFSLGLNIEPLNEKLEEAKSNIADTAKTANTVIQETEKASRRSFNRVLSSARLAWSTMDTIFRAFGINMGRQFRLLIQSGFSAVSALSAVYTAQESNPFTAAFGALSLAELGTAIIALIQAQLGEKELAAQLAKTSRALFSVGNFLNSMNFL